MRQGGGSAINPEHRGTAVDPALKPPMPVAIDWLLVPVTKLAQQAHRGQTPCRF